MKPVFESVEMLEWPGSGLGFQACALGGREDVAGVRRIWCLLRGPWGL